MKHEYYMYDDEGRLTRYRRGESVGTQVEWASATQAVASERYDGVAYELRIQLDDAGRQVRKDTYRDGRHVSVMEWVRDDSGRPIEVWYDGDR